MPKRKPKRELEEAQALAFIPFYTLFPDDTNVISTSLCDALMMSHGATYITMSSCDALMMSCPFGMKPMHMHTCVIVALPYLEHACWCVHTCHTHMVTNCDPKHIP